MIILSLYRKSALARAGSQRGRRPCHLPPNGVSHGVYVRPAETAAAQQHVPDQRLDGRLAHQPDEEQLLDDLRADRAQGRQPEQQFAEPDRLVGILRPAVLFQGALRFFLQRLDVRHVRQSAGVCKTRQKYIFINNIIVYNNNIL